MTRNFLFVVPKYARKGQFYNFPTGLASVYTYLQSKGFHVSCLNLCHTELTAKQALAEAMRGNQVDVVCTGGMSQSCTLIKDVLTAAKQIRPSVTTVVGGPIITADPELAMTLFPIDYGIKGEGELTMAELAAVLQYGGSAAAVKGLVYRDERGDLRQTQNRPSLEPLDLLPIIDYEAFGFREWTPLYKYAHLAPMVASMDTVRYAEVMGSRSCPFSCTFCYHPLGQKYRQRSLDHLFREIDLLTKGYDVNVLNFLDDLFSADNKRLFEFAKRIAPYKIRWLASLRVNDISRDLLDAMKESGMLHVLYGIENINEAILKSMKKHTTRKEIEYALRTARDAGMFCSGNIILGDPAETPDTMAETIDWWLNHPMYDLSMGFLLAIPDSPIYRLALGRGLIRDKYLHVLNRFPFVNLTSLSNWRFYNNVLRVGFLNLFHRNVRNAELLGSERLAESHDGRVFHLLHLKCPHCGDTRSYRRFTPNRLPYFVIACETCCANMKVPQRRAFPRDHSVIRSFGFVASSLAHISLLRFRMVRDYRYLVMAALNR